MEIEPIIPMVLSAPLLAMFTMEVVKWVFRKWIIKDPEHDFPPIFYEVLIPLFTGIWGYVLAYVGWGDPVTFDLMTLLRWAIASVLTLGMYQLTLSPLKAYGRAYREEREYKIQGDL